MRWFVLMFWWLPSLAWAQVNVEKLRSNGVEDGFSGSANLTTAFTYGNIHFADFGLTAHQEFKSGKHTAFWIMNTRFAAKRTQSDIQADPKTGLWDKDSRFANLMLQHLRYNYEIASPLWLEIFTQYEYNEFLLLDRRLVGGLGLRFALVNGDKGGVFFGSAAMLEEERLNEEQIAPSEAIQRVNIRSSNYLSATLTPNDGGTWTTTIYFQPRFDSFSDYRLVGETGLSLKLNDNIAFTADARYRRDSAPPKTPQGTANVLPTDVSIKNGIKVSW